MSVARPILFSGAMLRALLAGRKTQTRRIVKPQPAGEWAAPGRTSCPYGKPGDLLWVRESFRIEQRGIRATGQKFDSVIYRADSTLRPEFDPLRWKPSIHMPRWASRITLRISDIRVERLQDISYEDAVAEGCEFENASFEPVIDGETFEQTARRLRWPQRHFEALWNSLNGAGPWEKNPWVWVIGFEVIKANVDEVLKREAA